MTPWLTVVGMGDDGPHGLAPAARAVVEQARVVVGGQRHLDLLGPGERERIPWPRPFSTLTETLDRLRGRAVCVLATGDPTCHGVGSILAEAVRTGRGCASFPHRPRSVSPVPGSAGRHNGSRP